MFSLPAHRLRTALVFSALGLLCACSNEPPSYDYSAPNYAGQSPFELDVAAIQVDNQSNPSASTKNYSKYFPVNLEQAVQQWSRERLWAVGDTRRLVVKITEATVDHLPKPEEAHSDLDEYRVHLAVTVDIYGDEKASPEASVNAQAEVKREIFNDVSENAQRSFFAGMTRDLMTKIDTNLTGAMSQYFGEYRAYRGARAPRQNISTPAVTSVQSTMPATTTLQNITQPSGNGIAEGEISAAPTLQ
jgi:hypothetical protein